MKQTARLLLIPLLGLMAQVAVAAQSQGTPPTPQTNGPRPLQLPPAQPATVSQPAPVAKADPQPPPVNAAPLPGDPQAKIRSIRELANLGEEGIAGIAAYANDPAPEVRAEMARRLAEIGGPRVQPSLLRIVNDRDPEVQIRAIDGLVNIYLPGYLKAGISRTLTRGKEGVRVSFAGDNDQVVDGYVTVQPAVIDALVTVLRTATFESRANAARALGVLQAQSASPDLVNALYSKNDQMMLESLIALQKLRDPSVGPKLEFLVRDLAEPVQLAALQTVGILRTREALADVRYLVANARAKNVEREALLALSRIADPADHDIFRRYLTAKDAASRMIGAEGLARLQRTDDLHRMTEAFLDEKDTAAKLANAFAMVAMGRLETNDFAPLGYLINSLVKGAYRTQTISYLTELTREGRVRAAVHAALTAASKVEKVGIIIALGRSGEEDTVPFLKALQSDSDPEVSQQALVSLRTLETRLKSQ